MNLNKQEIDLIMQILENCRVDAILEENELDVDELGIIMAKLGNENYKELYLT